MYRLIEVGDLVRGPLHLGGVNVMRKGARRIPALIYATLGADLYGGTAGIAVFLAELAAATGEAGCRRTALGAIRHALAREPDLPPALNLGLYSGRIGIALAAARVGSLLADDDLLGRSPAIVRGLEGTGNEFDLITGRAGAVVGLLALRDLLDEPGLLERACRFGEELIGLAVKRARSWSWASPGSRQSRHLLGLSHGASGAGYALWNWRAQQGTARSGTRPRRHSATSVASSTP